MRRALIGHTGFVGSNLDRQLPFAERYNSKNFTDMRGESFDEVVCAGVQAVKWWANQNPEEDWAGITPLLDVLATVKAARFILISTVDVYRMPRGVDEATPIETDGLHAYGLHRWRVEERVRAEFPAHTILRLPGLYGRGLKKNLIYDVLTGGDISGFDHRSSFQFYNLDRLGRDLGVAVEAGIGTVNLAVAPVDVGAVVTRLTGDKYDRQTDTPPLSYDMRSIHAARWGATGPYLETAAESLQGIADFADGWRREGAA